ncbi:hypothetical protein Ahy_A02g005206 isoform C [Arachis hypogaea]|uniref:Uncharacterized protein n=1 Tax=Arachis hypogaea TaxID=3818 RepID=A0A445E6D7_ARAHY|nr:hypothetical protein Ahy_A02g005206 isoform C [Arachis hypogaea]
MPRLLTRWHFLVLTCQLKPTLFLFQITRFLVHTLLFLKVYQKM